LQQFAVAKVWEQIFENDNIMDSKEEFNVFHGYFKGFNVLFD